LHNAPQMAAELGLECFQFFSRPPQGGMAKPITEEDEVKFKEICVKHNFTDYYIHTPYVLNLASDKAEVRHRTASIIRSDLERASQLGATAVMTHLGSASKINDEKLGVKLVIDGLKEVLSGYEGTAQPLIEMSAGAGMVIGDTFEELATIIEGVADDRIGLCFDTAHAFASGYDLRNEETVNETLRWFDDIVGLEKLILSHANDSLVELGSHKDRHEHIGAGQIGLTGFRALISHYKFRNLNLILETPPGDGRTNDIAVLKKLRDELTN
ncbi:deoxyribonuclease IV, partial [Patescibacteria group bacterium]|nr:deoxyribonuclease IV [Patescibacteria group bacterium]